MDKIPKEEINLYQTKWFDYREISPRAANYLFFREWCRAHNLFMDASKLDQRFDERTMSWLIKDISEFGLDKVNSLRKIADKNCIPYDKFWLIMYRVLNDGGFMTFDIETAYSSAIAVSSVIEEYSEIRKAAIPLSDKITAETYSGSPGQVAYMAYLKTEVQRRYGNRWKEKLAVLKRQGKYVEINQEDN